MLDFFLTPYQSSNLANSFGCFLICLDGELDSGHVVFRNQTETIDHLQEGLLGLLDGCRMVRLLFYHFKVPFQLSHKSTSRKPLLGTGQGWNLLVLQTRTEVMLKDCLRFIGADGRAHGRQLIVAIFVSSAWRYIFQILFSKPILSKSFFPFVNYFLNQQFINFLSSFLNKSYFTIYNLHKMNRMSVIKN